MTPVNRQQANEEAVAMSQTKVSEVQQGQCYCGAVTVTVQGPPVMAGYCHCLACRKWHGAPINAFAVWAADQVTLAGPQVVSQVSADSGRVSCGVCGGAVANQKPQFGMTVVYPMTLAPTPLAEPVAFEPMGHLFYGERVMDVADGLPKYRDRPQAMGGSGEELPDAPTTGWRAREVG